MAKLNVKAKNKQKTHEGGSAAPSISTLAQLERQVATCMLWENTFYEKGSDIAASIAAGVQTAVKNGHAFEVAGLAVRARHEFKLRHVPLHLCRELMRTKEGRGVATGALSMVIRRPDEVCEFLKLYWKDKKQPVCRAARKGIEEAFRKFSPYQLQKYAGRDGEIKLRDALRIAHPRPLNQEQRELWKQVLEGTLPPADTWEVALSAGKDKCETWTRLLNDGKLGYMALLMNLRNMDSVGVDKTLIEQTLIGKARGSWALPFRFVSAANACPTMADACSRAMLAALENSEKLPGNTVVVVDVSGSMSGALSEKSKMTCKQAAGALAALCREVCEHVRLYAFSDGVWPLKDYRGLPLVDNIQSLGGGGTPLKASLNAIAQDLVKAKFIPNRTLVITDEQSCDGIGECDHKGYILNVAAYAPGLDTNLGWHRINGFSERIIDWIRYSEGQAVQVDEESTSDEG